MEKIKMFGIWAVICLIWVIFVSLFLYGVNMMFGTIGIIVVSILFFMYYIYNLYKIW
jgi:hypothetical protein